MGQIASDKLEFNSNSSDLSWQGMFRSASFRKPGNKLEYNSGSSGSDLSWQDMFRSASFRMPSSNLPKDLMTLRSVSFRLPAGSCHESYSPMQLSPAGGNAQSSHNTGSDNHQMKEKVSNDSVTQNTYPTNPMVVVVID
ncbi:unnamed protein product [Ilex paraguariensis]|uniref:Uncharacterized protein n=1 Tax=Ilex paraguariensis TaxID=185542 RepID=A0ABC8RNE1_9AQUA